MNRFLGRAVVVLGLWLLALELGFPALVVGAVLMAVGNRLRIGPPVGLIFIGACLLVVVKAVGGPIPSTAASGSMAAGDPFGGTCHPVVTQGYGPSTLVGEPIVNGVRFHTGVDLACPAGSPVHSVSAGIARVHFDSGFGNSVVVESGGYFVRYAHLSAVSVADGAAVQPGSLIGAEGSTGFSTGPHLHFEVDQGAPSVQRSVDPRPWLAGI